MTVKNIIKKKKKEKMKKELLNSLRENDENEHSQQFARGYRTDKPSWENNKDSV